MALRITVDGIAPVLHHNGSVGIDTNHPWNVQRAELARKKGTDRTTDVDLRIRQLDCLASIYFDAQNRPEVPARVMRGCLETAARKLKQGPLVREGLVVTDTEFTYDEERYGTSVEELGISTQYTVPVVVQRSRILRTRAMFDLPWAVDV